MAKTRKGRTLTLEGPQHPEEPGHRTQETGISVNAERGGSNELQAQGTSQPSGCPDQPASSRQIGCESLYQGNSWRVRN
jgi:hypothetical protein